jgi:hypothetical protein
MRGGKQVVKKEKRKGGGKRRGKGTAEAGSIQNHPQETKERQRNSPGSWACNAEDEKDGKDRVKALRANERTR